MSPGIYTVIIALNPRALHEQVVLRLSFELQISVLFDLTSFALILPYLLNVVHYYLDIYLLRCQRL